ncbi:MAG: hypothetical protein HN553_03210, partial [Opitutae bacterium]|nr:hypothetical protein [Opitutae bacterium]
GIKAWWRLDETSGNLALDQINGNTGTLVGIDDSARVFGKIGNAIRLDGAGEHIITKGFKGIVADKSRTLSFWIKTTNANGALVNWGANGDGANWMVSLNNGSLHLDIGGSRLTGSTILNNNAWHHIALVLPSGASGASDVFMYVDGNKESSTHAHDHAFPSGIGGLQLWLDASDLTTANGLWNDQSGNNNHATKNGSPTVVTNAVNGNSIMRYSGANGEYHSFNRISDIRTVFWVFKRNSGYWYLLGDTSSYNFHSNPPGDIFHSTYAHGGIKAGSSFAINGTPYDIYGSWPTDMSIASLVTSQNVQANNFSNDRNIGGRYANGDLGELLIYNTALSVANVNRVYSYLSYKWGFMGVNTSSQNDLRVGTDENGNHFNGIIDEIRLYEHSLSSEEVNSIALNGTMKFQTSSVALPPVVEITTLIAEANGSAIITGNLISKDSNLPTVRVYYGNENGGFDTSNWDSWVDVSSGNPLNLGEFNASVSGLTPGETYYFRTFATSADGVDWSSGDPQVIDDLMAFWRFDEESGIYAFDSTYPANTAKFEGSENNITRPAGFNAQGLYFDGGTNWLNLDSNSSGYLGNSFEGRTISFRFKPTAKVYAGPALTKYSDLAAYFPFDEGTGASTSDLSINQLTGTGNGGFSWSAGNAGQAISLDGVNDSVSLETHGVLKELHKNSYSISLWVNPASAPIGKYSQGQLNAFGFKVPMSEAYLSGTDILFSLTPSGSSLLTSGPSGTGLAFDNDDHFKNAGLGINQNDNYMSLFTGVFQAKEQGTYTFEVRGNDDRGVLWFDLDQDGMFEATGNLGNEKILDAAIPIIESKGIVLSPGYYSIALVHGEKTGGAT